MVKADVVGSESSDHATEENPLEKTERETNGFLRQELVSEEDSSSTMSEETLDQSQADLMDSVNDSAVSLDSGCNSEASADLSCSLGEKTKENGVDYNDSIVDLNSGQVQYLVANGRSDKVEESISMTNGEAPVSKDEDSTLDNGHENLRSSISKPLFPRGFLDRNSILSSRKILDC